MSQAELNLWVAYVHENGPLNIALRIDAAIARGVARAVGGIKPRELMPWPKEPEQEATPESVHALFKGLAAQKPKGTK